jgi:rRNA maturation endonuclease Nob1
MWSSMGVFDKARNVSHLGEQTGRPYICLACEASFDLQHHACPACGGYDIRRAKWVE